MQDLSNLKKIYERQPRQWVFVSLYLSRLDFGTDDLSSPMCFGYRPTPERFRDQLCSTIDAAVQKGATYLDVNGGFRAFQSLGAPTQALGIQPGPAIAIRETPPISEVQYTSEAQPGPKSTIGERYN